MLRNDILHVDGKSSAVATEVALCSKLEQRNSDEQCENQTLVFITRWQEGILLVHGMIVLGVVFVGNSYLIQTSSW